MNLFAQVEFPISKWIGEIVPNVFDTMLSLPVTVASTNQLPSDTERVVGTIGIGGESIVGAIYLQLTLPLALQVTSVMLGMSPSESPNASDVNDAVGELCNMVSGSLKSAITDSGFPCAISTPAIIRGTSFSVEAPPDTLPETFYFDCPEHRLAVEVHLQIQSNN